MNKARRERISNIVDEIDELLQKVENLREEEEEAYDNLPDAIQESEKGDIMQEAISSLESCYGYLEQAKEYAEECCE